MSGIRQFEFIHLDFKSRNNAYKVRSQPRLELVNSKFNSLYKNSKIYKVVFSNDKIYVRCTCDELKTRIDQHLKDTKSQVYKNKKHNPVFMLIIDKKTLEAIDKKYIEEYADKYGNLLINKRCNPKNEKQYKKEPEIQYQIETER